MIWHEAILANNPPIKAWPSTKECRRALQLATLFHDARHLPFSHMMEEVFKELNWGIPSPGSTEASPDWIDSVIPDMDSDFGRRLKQLNSTGHSLTSPPRAWWESTVIPLQEGRTGTPWLEAIVDSALDADKIHYVFNDAHLTGQHVRLPGLRSWLEDFLSGQTLTPEGLIRLDGQAASAALALLQERMYLYRHVYLAPELRALESFVRYIVTTWLEWKVPQVLSVHPEEQFGVQEGDLRRRKAKAAADLLWSLFERKASAVQNELLAVNEMADELRNAPYLDVAAQEWIDALWFHLKHFPTTTQGYPSLRPAQEQYTRLAPIGPFYSHAHNEAEIRLTCRRLRVHHPLVSVIDAVRFPRFLPTPSQRGWRQGGQLNPQVA